MPVNYDVIIADRFYRENGVSVNLHHQSFDEHAYRMGYPAGHLAGLYWGVYDQYGIRARQHKSGVHYLERTH